MKYNELDLKFLLDLVLGISMFLIGVFWDMLPYVRLNFYHKPDFGLGQFIWCAFWGIYILGTWLYMAYYGE